MVHQNHPGAPIHPDPFAAGRLMMDAGIPTSVSVMANAADQGTFYGSGAQNAQ